MTPEEFEQMDRLGYVCHDPDCEATHVDFDSLPEANFTEGPDYAALFTEPGMRVIAKRTSPIVLEVELRSLYSMEPQYSRGWKTLCSEHPHEGPCPQVPRWWNIRGWLYLYTGT